MACAFSKHRKSAKLPWRHNTKLWSLSFVFLSFCHYGHFVFLSLSFCNFVFLPFCYFVFLLFCLFVMMPFCFSFFKCLKCIICQKSLFVSNLKSGTEWPTHWPRSGIELQGQLKILTNLTNTTFVTMMINNNKDILNLGDVCGEWEWKGCVAL